MHHISIAQAPIASARERQAAIVNELKRLQGKDLPTPALRNILDALLKVAQFTEKRIVRYEKDLLLSAKIEGSYIAPSLADLDVAVEPLPALHLILEIFDKSDSSRIPFELVRAFEQFTSDLLHDDVAFLFRPTRSYGYAVLDLYQHFSKEGLVWKPFTEVRPHAFLIQFPSAEAGSVLLHTLLFHEIGHTYWARNIDSSKFDELVGEVVPSGDVTVRNTLRAWIEEIGCDLLALRLAGPAFLCAFQFFWDPFLKRELWSNTHPKLVTRRRAIYQYLEHLRATFPELDATCKLFGDYCTWTEDHSDTNDITTELSPAVTAVEDTKSRLWQYIFELLDKCPCPFLQRGINQAINDAVVQLGTLVPPVVRSLQSNWGQSEVLAIAFCAAWNFRINYIHQWTEGRGWPEERAQRALSEMLLAGVEAGELELRYRNRSEGN